MSGLKWKRNVAEILERRRGFLRREMQDGVLATLPVDTQAADEWQAFERRWPQYPEGEERPFPCNEEIFERVSLGLQARTQVEDDSLPVVYSTLDGAEGIVGAMYGGDIRFLHRPRQATFSATRTPTLADYNSLSALPDPMAGTWAGRLLDIQRYFATRMDGCFGQHPFLTEDGLNFAVEMRGATQAYIDLYEHPAELRALLELGLDYNIRFQEAQRAIIGSYDDGCFVWLGEWVPFPRAISLSVDAYVICAIEHYEQFGFEYQARLIEHFGDGLMHFHCQRADLARAVAQLPGLRLFQFGGDTRDPLPAVERLPEIRRAVGEIPIQVDCSLAHFATGLRAHTLMPNVWYCVHGGPLTVDAANRLMDEVRGYNV